MNVDDQGHKHGWGSREYEHAAEVSINIIDCYLICGAGTGMMWSLLRITEWMSWGIILGIHGFKGGPLICFSDQIQPGNYGDHTVSQLNVAPLICRLMGIEPSGRMMDPSEEIRW